MLVSIFLMTHHSEHLFICLIVIYMSGVFLVKIVFSILSKFLFFVTRILRVLYMFSITYDLQMFPPDL